MAPSLRSTTQNDSVSTRNDEDEFAVFNIAGDTNLINPGTKAGKILFDQLAKATIKPENRIKGMSSEGESFRILMKELAAKGNFKDILTFIDSDGKKHDLANAPEFTSIEKLVDHNNRNVWNFKNNVVQNG